MHRRQQEHSQNTANFRYGPWPTLRDPGTPRSIQVPAHTVPNQRHWTPNISAIQPHFLRNPHQPEAYQDGLTNNHLQQDDARVEANSSGSIGRGARNLRLHNPNRPEIIAPQLPGTENHMMLQHNHNSMNSRGSIVNRPASSVQKASVAEEPVDLPELHTQYKNLLRSYHDLPADELRYLQKLKIVLQQRGYIKNSARNQATSYHTAQDAERGSSSQFPQSGRLMQSSGPSSSAPRIVGTPRMSGATSADAQLRQSQRQQSKFDFKDSERALANVQTRQKTKRKAKSIDPSLTSNAIEEDLIAPQPKRVRRILGHNNDAAMFKDMAGPVAAVNGTFNSSSAVPNAGGSEPPKSAANRENGNPPNSFAPKARAETLTHFDQPTADGNLSKNLTLHKEPSALSHSIRPLDTHVPNRRPEVVHHSIGTRTESWTVGEGEETTVKPRGLIEHLVEPDTVLYIISKDAGNTYVCSSGSQDRTYMSLNAGQMGMMASYQVKAKEAEGVPREHVKMAVFDDRVGFQGPTAEISDTGDVISLAKGPPTPNKRQSTPLSRDFGNIVDQNHSEHTSITPTPIETGSQENTSRPLITTSPGGGIQNSANPAQVSIGSLENNFKTTQPDPVKSSPEIETPNTEVPNTEASNAEAPNTEAPIVDQTVTTQLTYSPICPAYDPMANEECAPISDEEFDIMFRARLRSPAICADKTTQAQEDAVHDAKGAEEASSSLLEQQLMEGPVVTARAAGTVFDEYPSQTVTMLGNDDASQYGVSQLSSHAGHQESHHNQNTPILSNVMELANNEGPASPKPIIPTPLPTLATESMTENMGNPETSYEFMAGAGLSNLLGDDLFNWDDWDANIANLY